MFASRIRDRTCVRTSAMAYYLGIDGGGTKTRCLLGDETSVLAESMSGGSNIVRLGEARAREALHAAIAQVTASAHVSSSQIHAVCIGAAGADRPEIAARIRGFVVEIIPHAPPSSIEVVGDSVIALEAAFGMGPGVIAIAGTGSIVHGRDAAGRTARAGGWGFALSDEGSGHWIGRGAVSAILNALDEGRELALTSRVLESWKIDTIDELVQRANSTPPPDFARLFPVVLRAADNGDATARGLLLEAGTRLAGLAATVIRRLAPPTAPASLPVALTGSLFRQSEDVRRIFYNTLNENFPGIEVRPGLVDPAEGALARARKM